MKLKISFKNTWEENISLLIIVLGFIELQTEAIHEVLKWPMIGLSLIALIGCYLSHRVDKRISAIILLMIVLGTVEIVFSDVLPATLYIWDFGVWMPVALTLYYAKQVHLKKWLTLYVIVTMYLIFRLATSPDHYTIFYSHSRNYISVFEIFLMFVASVVAYKKQLELPGWMYYSTAIVCVIAIGRGGIVAGGVLLGFHILQNLSKEKKSGNKTTKIILLLVGIILLFIIFLFFQEAIIQRFFPRFGGVGSAGDSSDIGVSKRMLMWGGYIDSCLNSWKSFFIGEDPYPIVLRVHYRIDFNLHNSFLMTHVFYGIVGVVGVLIFIVKFLKRFIKEKSEVAVIFFSFIVRALTDHCFPGKLSVIIIWFAIFYVIADSQKKRKKQKGKVYEQYI